MGNKNLLKQLLLINGANLNWLGKRDAKHYGALSLIDIEKLTAQAASKFGYQLISYQSNHEGSLIDALQLHSASCAGIIINPGAFAHYSYALHDALLDTCLPVVEVHLSDINSREPWRQKLVTAAACIKVISGKQEHGYIEAVNVLIERIGNE